MSPQDFGSMSTEELLAIREALVSDRANLNRDRRKPYTYNERTRVKLNAICAIIFDREGREP